MKQTSEKGPEKLQIDGGLVIAAVASGLLAVPLFGFLPLLGIGAAIGASYFLVNQTRPK